MRKIKTGLLTAVLLAVFAFALSAAEIQNGDTVAFLGDSITNHGWKLRDGYIQLCGEAFRANGLQVKIIPAGVNGNMSGDMLARLDLEVLAKRPSWMTLSCGVNDVWHRPGTDFAAYRRNVTAILDRCAAAGVKVLLLTATMVQEDENNENNTRLREYNDWLRQLAADRQLPLADVGKVMREQVAAHRASGRKDNLFTWDGVHMRSNGNRMLAETLLRAWQFDDGQLKTARSAWEKMGREKQPSRFVIDLDARDSKVILTEVQADPAKFQKPEFPSWVGAENRQSYVQFRGKYDLSGKWEQFSFSFVPQNSGKIKMRLRGINVPPKYIRWCAYDKIEAEGAEIVNGSFEEHTGRSAAGWRTEHRSVKLNRNDAADGSVFVECAWYVFGDQIFEVKAGQKVTVHFMARGGALEVK